jgi:hypothetical protein
LAGVGTKTITIEEKRFNPLYAIGLQGHDILS